MSRDYEPASLPEITSLEIYVLGERSEDESQSQFITIGKTGFLIQKCFAVDGQDAQAIADLWRRLPEYIDPDRCHFPPFGLRFYKDNDLILSASICWECHNIWLKMGEMRNSFILDAEHEIAQNLLKLLKKLSKS